MAHHPRVRQVDLDVAIAREDVGRQRAQFWPVLNAQGFGRYERAYNEFGAATDPDVVSQQSAAAETWLAGKTTFGGIYELRVRGQRASQGGIPSPTIVLSPRYEGSVSAKWTQPLLRGAGHSGNKALVDRAELNVEVAKAAEVEQLELLVIQVVEAYWTLVLRREQGLIQETALAQATAFREFVTRRVRSGRDPRSDLVQADATLAERKQAVQTANLATIEAERELLGLLYLERAGGLGVDDAIVPTEKPARGVEARSYASELEVALRNRADVDRVARGVERARTDVDIARNASKVRLDLYAVGGVLGVSGTPVAGAMPPDLVEGGASTVLRDLAKGEAPYVELGATVEIPLDNGDRAGAARQAALTLARARYDAVDVRAQVALDVRAALQRLRVANDRLSSVSRAEALSGQNVEVQRTRYEGGAGTAFDVLRAQSDLAGARGETVLAEVEQALALARLERARGTLLSRFGIKVRRTGS